jgi:hypothetical protein
MVEGRAAYNLLKLKCTPIEDPLKKKKCSKKKRKSPT